MTLSEKLIIRNLDIFASAIKAKSISGRGSNKKLEFYGVCKLRQLILDLAVRGMLVPQDPREETVVDLLDCVSKEKVRLIEKGLIKKKKALPTLSQDEIPFQIPTTWRWQQLDNITSILGDGIHGTPLYESSGDYHFINGNNLNLGKIEIKSETKKVSYEEYAKHKRNLNETSILVSINGSIGKVALYNNEKIILGKSACYFNLLGSINRFYIMELIKTEYFLKYAFQKATGSTIKNVSLKTMREFPVPIPPIAEQERIVAKVNRLMRLCDKLEHEQASKMETHNILVNSLLNALSSSTTNTSSSFQAWQPVKTNFETLFTTENSIDQLKLTILQLAVTGKLVPQDLDDEPASILLKKIQLEKANLIKNKKIKKTKLPNFLSDKEDFFNLPNGWLWAPLGIIGNIFNGNSISTDVKEHKYTNIVGRPYLSTKDIGYGFESPEYNNGVAIPIDEHNFKIASKNSVLICSEGGSAGKKCGITDREICFGNKLYANELHGNINPKFILTFYLTPLFYNQFSQFMTGIIGGVSISKFTQIQCPLPPLAEQSRIVSKVDELLDICEKLKKNISKKQNIQNRFADSLVEQYFR